MYINLVYREGKIINVCNPTQDGWLSADALKTHGQLSTCYALLSCPLHIGASADDPPPYVQPYFNYS